MYVCAIVQEVHRNIHVSLLPSRSPIHAVREEGEERGREKEGGGRGRKGRGGGERREGGEERGGKGEGRGEGRGKEGGGRRRKWGSTYLGSSLVLDEFLERREGNLDNMWVLCLTCKQQRVDNIVCLG